MCAGGEFPGGGGLVWAITGFCATQSLKTLLNPLFACESLMPWEGGVHTGFLFALDPDVGRGIAPRPAEGEG